MIHRISTEMRAIVAAVLLLTGAAWSAVEVNLGSSNVTLKNNTGSDYMTGMRIWHDQNVSLGWPFESLANGTFEGKKYYEYWLAGSALPVSAGSSQSVGLPWGVSYPSGTVGEPLLKLGVCNEPLPRCDEDPITLEELSALMKTPDYYKESYRYKGGDFMGKHGGKYSAGIFDSFCGETQFQLAIPTGQWTISMTGVRFNADNGGKGPLLWMALSANQEYYGTDYQVLLSSGMKESWLVTTGPSVMANVGLGELTPFHITQPTYLDQIAEQYATYYPHGLSFDRYLGGVSAADGVKTTEGQLAINGVVSSGFLWQSYYQQLTQSQSLAFKQVLENSNTGGDPLVGFCAMSFMYNQGPGYDAFYNMFLPNSQGGSLNDLMDNPQACETIAAGYGGFGDYVTTLRTNATKLEEASKAAETNASIQLLERQITLTDLQRFWFGGTAASPGTPEMNSRDQDGGLLLHYNLTTAERQALWSDVKQAFTMQAAKWGGNHISLRYDWISNLRVGKSHIGREVVAAITFWRQALIDKFSKGSVDGSGERIDRNYPFMSLMPIPATDSEGFAVEVAVQDPREWDRGIAKVEWSIKEDWSLFSTKRVSYVAGNPKNGRYKIDLTGVDLAPLNGAGGDLHVRVVDSCGNAVAGRTKIIGVVLPKVEKAYIKDTDGDGNGDQITVVTSEADDATASLADATGLQYSWPAPTPLLEGDKNLIRKGEFRWSDFDLVGGEVDGLGGKVEIKIGSYTLRANIADSVGPVIRYASVQEKRLDRLYIVFSENIKNLDDMTGGYLEINGTTVAITKVEKAEQIWVFTLAQPLDMKRLDLSIPLDSVRIVPGAIEDAVGNGAADNNRKVPIMLDKGPLEIDPDGFAYLDENYDGTMELIRMKFKQPAIGRTGTMELTFRWPVEGRRLTVEEFQVPGDKLEIDSRDPMVVTYDASHLKLRSNTTWFDTTQSGWGTAELLQKSVTGTSPAQRDVLPMQDKMGPIAVTATYGETSLPNRRPDTLSVEFSEPIDTASARLFSSQLYWTKSGDFDEKRYTHELPSVKKRFRNQILSVYYEPVHTERPGIGDSLRIVYDGDEAGVVQDLSGNRAHVLNPRVLIGGKLRVQVSTGDLFAVDGKEGIPSDTVLFFDNTFNLDSLTQIRAGIGFTISFIDSGGSREEQRFSFETSFYTNLGGFVRTLSGNFSCVTMEESGNPFLEAACDPSRYPASQKVKVFIPWDYRSQLGGLVGSGAYIQKVLVKGTRIETLEANRTIGVIRKGSGGTPWE